MRELRFVALHGNVGGPCDWDALPLPQMHALDLWTGAGQSMETFADHLAETWGGDVRTILLGYSLGGRLALTALARHPQAFLGAVILAAHSGLSTDEDRQARRKADADWARQARELPWAEFLARWNGQAVFGGSASPDRSDLEASRFAIADAFEHWSLGCQGDLRDALTELKIPILWLTGEGDPTFTERAADITRRLRDGRHRIIPGAGHRVLHDAPEAVRKEIQDWLDEQF